MEPKASAEYGQSKKLNRFLSNSTFSDESGDEFGAIRATLTSEEYNAATIRAEFKSYQSILPKPDQLLQEQHSFEILREIIQRNNVEMPRFLKYDFEGGIKPHYALCCLLLKNSQDSSADTGCNRIGSCLARALSLGSLYRQRNMPAEVIREQFNRVAHVIPAELVRPSVLRKKIRNSGLPIPNFFLDPENYKQFPPHIALLVILQQGEEESNHLNSVIYRIAWFWFASIAIVLRLVLEVIGGAGAIWGGTEVFYLRTPENAEQCRAASMFFGFLCLIRFVILNAPQNEDHGDILGPAGPWSLRSPARSRAVCEHPFHYFLRARRPYSNTKDQPPLDKSK